MASVTLYNVLKGTRLLDSTFKAVDGNGDGRVTKTELSTALARADDFVAEEALSAVHRLASVRYGADPSLENLRKTLGQATAAAAKADENGSQNLNDGEQDSLAATYRTVVEFSGKHAFSEVKDLLPPLRQPSLSNDQVADLIAEEVYPNMPPGRNAWTLSLSTLPDSVRAKIEAAESKSHRGIHSGEFNVDYYAVVRPGTDEVVGYALHRSAGRGDLSIYQVMGFNLNGTRVFTEASDYWA